MRFKAMLSIALALSFALGAFMLMDDSDGVDGAPSGTAVVGIPYSGVITKADNSMLVSLVQDILYMESQGNPDGFDCVLQVTPSWLTPFYKNQTVILSGTPPASGSVSVNVYACLTEPNGQILGSTNYEYVINVVPPSPLEFSNPPVIDMVSGQTLSYTPTTNIPSTITLESGAPSWVTLSGGVLTVSAPSVSEKTTFTAVLKATAGSQTATQTITMTVSPKLEVVSSFPGGEYVAGTLYSYSPVASVSSGTWSLQGAPAWLTWDAESKAVKGTVPSYITSIQDVTYTLKVYSEGPSQDAEQIVTVRVVPVLSFTSIPTADMIISSVGGKGRTFQFTPTGDSVDTILWDFGDGVTSTEWAPEHTYSEPGVYTVTVTMSNELGSDTFSSQVQVLDDSDVWDEYKGFILAGVLLLMVGIAVAIRRL